MLEEDRPRKVLTVPLQIGVGLIILNLFGISSYLPIPVSLGAIGLVIIGVLYPIRFSAKREKQLVDKLKLALVISYVTYATMSLLHWPFRFPILVLTGMLFVVWFYLDGLQFLGWRSDSDEAKTGNDKRADLLIVAAIGMGVLGMIFKIQHWPGASVMLILALVIGLIWLLVGTFAKKD